jgi:hypothetical protein
LAAAALRRVQADCAIEIDTNACSVPWRLIGETVRVVVAGGRISIQHGGREVAVHPRRPADASGWPTVPASPRLGQARARRLRHLRRRRSPTCSITAP